MASKSTENGNVELMTNEMQCAVHTCKTHTSEVMDMYCSTCNQPHCLQCIKEKHISHDWDKLSKIAKSIRDEVPSKCQKVSSTTVVRIQDNLDGIKDARLALSERKEEKIGRIKQQKEKILSIIDSKADKMISNLNSSVDVIDKKLDSMESLSRSDLTDVGHFVQILEQNRLTASDNVIIELANKLDVRVNKATLSPNTQNLPSCPEFVEGKINADQLEWMIGSIQFEKKLAGIKAQKPPSVKLSEKMSEFQHGDKEIHSISQTNDTSAWILQLRGTKVEMLSLDGKQVTLEKHLNNEVDDFVVSKTGDFIYTDYDNCSVKMLSRDGQMSTVLNSGPLHPKAIHLCPNDDLLVALIDNKSYTDDNKENMRIIRRVTMSGDTVSTYQYEKRSKLFTIPISVFENYNTDICVVDRTELREGQLCVLFKDGTIKFRYTGQKMDRTFCPLDATCDRNCNIILSDWYNNCIHLLSPGGEFLKFLVTDESGLKNPRSLCLYKNNLWIGCKRGIIRLYEYII